MKQFYEAGAGFGNHYKYIHADNSYPSPSRVVHIEELQAPNSNTFVYSSNTNITTNNTRNIGSMGTNLGTNRNITDTNITTNNTTTNNINNNNTSTNPTNNNNISNRQSIFNTTPLIT